MALTLEVKPAEGPVSRIRLQPGRNRFSVRVGDTFRVYDDQTGLTPDGASVKRIDNSLIVDGLPGEGEPIVVEFAEFYTLCSAGSPCRLLVQEQAGGEPVAITPGSPSIGALSDARLALLLLPGARMVAPTASIRIGNSLRCLVAAAGVRRWPPHGD